jgi:20S proteasome alpha/beta subunit
VTLIVGILCSDGVVMASDSAATLGSDGCTTIGQQHIRKIHPLATSLIYSSCGSVGMSQLIAARVRRLWEEGGAGGVKNAAEMMDKIGRVICDCVSPYLKSANLVRPLVGDASSSLCKSLVAVPIKKQPCLFAFDFGGAPEHATPELPFMALGSGQAIADPFLAFLKRLLWPSGAPSLSEGKLAAIWTIDHVRKTNPGGVGGPIQLATLASADAGIPVVTLFEEQSLQEHLVLIRAAEQALIGELKPESAAATGPMPKLPS